MIPSEYIEPEVSQATCVADPEPGPSTTPAVKRGLEQELYHQDSIVATGIEVRNQETVHGIEVTEGQFTLWSLAESNPISQPSTLHSKVRKIVTEKYLKSARKQQPHYYEAV
ncbi:hypothetical protein LOTGIDRAFT_173643 [Lottia gigantea]|uniref:Uncharacterized protein n=1 Tax=Lottia gigantea TaxID=225164 RepID=V4CCK7_LOTGI|nr:hypothetical protein LOTGIDRAFT_173643 [Lottia gigantea]ESO99634.1 hypothetical protein LOTGIDRAFT_173643 [Lottia gigantea]